MEDSRAPLNCTLPSCTPLALLLNLGAASPPGAALHALLQGAGVSVRDVAPSELEDPVGYLAGLPGYAAAEKPYGGAVPATEFVLLCHMPDNDVMALVRAMRAAGVSVGCKATLTEHNRSWKFADLVEEVAAEHAAMAQMRAAQQ